MRLKVVFSLLLSAALVILPVSGADAHFLLLIPSSDVQTQSQGKNLTLDLSFSHPFEGDLMNMGKPKRFGVWTRGKQVNLLDSLKALTVKGFTTFQAEYTIKRPGDLVFYVEPAPYFEPAEGKVLIHYTKVVVNAFGLEKGWDRELGLKAEIVPLVRPYGLWTGNVFRGIVKFDGRPVPWAEIEVEYLNREGKTRAPAPAFVTQVIKADGNGVFCYAVPKAGWWVFAALMESPKKMTYKGRAYPVEIGASMWVRAVDMR